MKLKKFIDIYIPTTACNLSCEYCYISLLDKKGNEIGKIGHSAEEIRGALSVKRLGGICMLNICAGGETLLSDEILPIVKSLCEEGHYVMVVTNGTIKKRIAEIEKWPITLRKHLFLKFSLHYLELERLGLLDSFAENVKTARGLGCSITVEITPNDALIPYIENLKKYCLKNFGALCHCTIARDDRKKGIDILSALSKERYKEVWGQFDSDLFDYKMHLYQVRRKEFCYAGAWSFYINLMTGDVRQCYCGVVIDNIYRNIERRIKELPIGKSCSLAYCYNGHAFMAFGNIPHLDDTKYARLRDRKTAGEKRWLQEEMREAMECKLQDGNIEYTEIEKKEAAVKNFFLRKVYFIKQGYKKIWLIRKRR